MHPFRPLFLVLCCLHLPAAETARDAGTPFDLQGFIDQELKAGRTTVVVKPGRYRVKPSRSQHLVFRDRKDVTIDCTGVEMVCTETTRALTIANCVNLTLKGLTIDYDPLFYTQGRITAMSPDRKVHEIALYDGYPRAGAARNFKYEIFRADTRLLRCHCYGLKTVEVVDDAHLRLTKDGGNARDPEEVGDIIAIGAEHTPGGNAGHAVECSSNRNVTLEDITLYASNCFGFLENGCEATTYRRCTLDRRPPATDLIQREPRIRSGDADAFHSKHAIVGPRYLQCVARFQGDDCVNICGDYHLVMGGTGRELRVLAKHDMNIEVGDVVEVVAYDGRRLPDATVTAVAKEAGISDEEMVWLRRQRMNDGLRTNAHKSLSRGFAITLDREVALPRGSVIASTRRIGNGFVIDGCTFGFNRSRGILIKASNGSITNCTLQGSWEVGILVAPEWWWLESGSSSHLVITGNRISDCPTPGIVVQATGGNGTIAPAGAHQDITISGNVFSHVGLPYILCTSTSGLRLDGNTFPVEPGVQAGWGAGMVPKEERGRNVVRVNCPPVVTATP